jgi:hypothetical protein
MLVRSGPGIVDRFPATESGSAAERIQAPGLSAYQASRAVTEEIVVIPAIAHMVMPGSQMKAE